MILLLWLPEESDWVVGDQIGIVIFGVIKAVSDFLAVHVYAVVVISLNESESIRKLLTFN